MAKNLYRDLLVWQKSVSLIKEVYAEADKLPKSEEYNLKQQLKRAVVSVSLNIAEGKNRRTAKDFIVETPIPKAKRSGIGKLNYPAKRRV